MFRKILIANRGEIACRIASTCRRLGIDVATVHSEADRGSLHVRLIGESIEIGSAPAAQSYLKIEAIIDAARRVGADALHPGIGFLAENPDFAHAVEQAGLVFIGPRAETIDRFADKWAAKSEAIAAGLPTIGGSQGSFNQVETIEAAVRELPLPVLLKAAAGGGGRGVRIVEGYTGLKAVIESAMREAQSSFGRPDIIVEQFIERPRHIEAQIAGDGNGNVIHLFERECSLQRRFQKILEEAPAASLDRNLAERMHQAAISLASRVKYRGLGTMEFLVSGERFYFLECNPRIQVEHTVTEEVTGLDLVELQIRIAADNALPITQDKIGLSGHAIQARIYAEDPCRDFLPSTGRVDCVRFPSTVRVDAGVQDGSYVTPFYDPMIAKVIAKGRDRSEALQRLQAALANSIVLGLRTNLDFLLALLQHANVVAGLVDNRFIDRELEGLTPARPAPDWIAAIAAAYWIQSQSPGDPRDPWSEVSGWALSDGTSQAEGVPDFALTTHNEKHAIHVGCASFGSFSISVDGTAFALSLDSLGDHKLRAALGDRAVTAWVFADVNNVSVHCAHGTWSFGIRSSLETGSKPAARSGFLRAPMMGAVVSVNIDVGQSVREGEALIVMESMKMELSIAAPFDGTVSSCHCQPGDMIERNAIVVVVEPLAA